MNMERITAEAEPVMSFTESIDNNKTTLQCYRDKEKIGSIVLTQIKKDLYDVSGLFVDPSFRGQGIGSLIVKQANKFLETHHAVGKLVNMISGDAAVVYEKNKWVRGEYISQGAYGAYEYYYDGKNKGI